MAESFFPQHQQHRKVGQRLIFKSSRNAKKQSEPEQSVFEIIINAQYQEENHEDIILAEDKLTVNTDGANQKSKLAEFCLFLFKSDFHGNFIQKMGRHKIQNNRQKLIPHEIDKRILQDSRRNPPQQIERKIPNRKGQEGTGQVIGIKSLRLLITGFVKVIQKTFII